MKNRKERLTYEYFKLIFLKVLVFICLACVTIFSSSCAIGHANQLRNLRIDSTPQNASVRVYDSQNRLVLDSTTPATYRTDKGRNANYRVVISKPGFATHSSRIETKGNGMIWADILCGGLLALLGPAWPAQEAGWRDGQWREATNGKEEWPFMYAVGAGYAVGATLLTATSNNTSVPNTNRINVRLQQEPFASRVVNKMIREIPQNTTIAILNLNSTSRTETADIRNDLTFRFHETRRFTLIDRVNLDAIIREQRLQWSGEIDTRTAVELGRFSGVRIVITGNLVAISNSWAVPTLRTNQSGSTWTENVWYTANSRHLTVQALDVETGRIISIAKEHEWDIEDPQYNRERDAIIRAVRRLQSEIQTNTAIAISNINSDNVNTSAVFTDEITFRLFETQRFRIMNRGDLDRIRREQGLQHTGQVDPRTATELRRLHGVGVIITGDITYSGNNQFLTLQALDTETANVISVAREQIR